MVIRVKYNDGERECFMQVCGKDIEVDMLTRKGINIVQIPDEEYQQGFRATEREDEID